MIFLRIVLLFYCTHPDVNAALNETDVSLKKLIAGAE